MPGGNKKVTHTLLPPGIKGLKALFILFNRVGKRLDKKAKVYFKIYAVTGFTTNNYYTNIYQYLKKSIRQ